MHNLCRCLRRRKHLSVHGLYRHDEQGVFCVFGMSCWYTENCNLHCSSKYRVYLLCRGVYLQHHNKCCDLHNLCCCLYRRIHLSIHGVYRNDEPSMFRVFVMSRWHKEKRHLYCSRKHGMHCLYSGIHLQHHYKCRDLYCLFYMYSRHLCIYTLFNHSE